MGIFGTIKTWFFARALNRHRLLFRFWDGSRFISSDPFVLLRRLTNTEKFDMESDLKMLQIPDPKIVTQKIGYIADGVREIFDLKNFESGGLSELECVQLLLTFSDFLDTVKKNGVLNPNSSPASDVSQMESSSAEKKGTNENSDSTSINPE